MIEEQLFTLGCAKYLESSEVRIWLEECAALIEEEFPLLNVREYDRGDAFC